MAVVGVEEGPVGLSVWHDVVLGLWYNQHGVSNFVYTIRYKFILLGDIVEEKVSETESRIVQGTILKVSDEAKEIRQLYKNYKKQGVTVLYALPTTPDEFIVENVLYMGILR